MTRFALQDNPTFLLLPRLSPASSLHWIRRLGWFPLLPSLPSSPSLLSTCVLLSSLFSSKLLRIDRILSPSAPSLRPVLLCLRLLFCC